MKMSDFEDFDPKNANNFNNREISWLRFNERVLEEVEDLGNPLLERLKYLAIFSSNLDEFFMVRVAGTKNMVKLGVNIPENKGQLRPREQLKQIGELAHELMERQYCFWNEKIKPSLEEEGIYLCEMEELTESQMLFIETYYDEQIFPVLTPVAIDAYRPFPKLLNGRLNIVVRLYDDEEEEEKREKLGVVQVPAVLGRYIQIPTERNKSVFVLLENVISYFLYKLFGGYKVLTATQFRITRDADITIHEETAEDLLEEVERELKKRKWGAAVRLEISEKGYDDNILVYLLEELEIDVTDVYIIDGPIDFKFLFSFYRDLEERYEQLVYKTILPVLPQDLQGLGNIFKKTLEQDVLFHHPFESFQPVVNFIVDAANDPSVLAIKQTLYRVSGHSPIIRALKTAAENGKQVTVLVELKARFDEENNVNWARELEEAGCHVIYGMNNLKTHSKITLIVRSINGKIERFVHLGTGNYNDATAKIYTDFGLITSKKSFGKDATHFFNYLSGFTDKPTFKHIITSPDDTRKFFIHKIEEEIMYHKQFGNGYIILKMNSLTDKKMIIKLYEASCAGVKIDLIVRGICCLRPGIKGVSENITVISIVGRYLEHSRVYYFNQNGKEGVYLSSADWMTRNMSNRIEISFPILDEKLKARVIDILMYQLMDNIKARYQTDVGTYIKRVVRAGEAPLDSQFLIGEYHRQNRKGT